MNIIDISEELFTELDEDATTSPALIGFWLRENIGKLNILVNSEYTISSDNSEITPDLGENEKSLLKQLYHVYFNGKKLQAVLSGADSNSVVEISEAGGTIRLLNKNELAKTYLALKRDEEAKLNDMIAKYRANNSGPIQVVGDDTVEGIYSSNSFERS